ncbi:MAG TPA: DegV family protein, partial [Candidatus Eremiobacteraceae bacterium]|nr:DegV family protein [Candidatus Eremiobacteraceae bacterium]
MTPGGVAVVTDSAADLGDAAAENGITVVPLTVRFGNEEFRDGVDLTESQFYQRLQTGGPMPITAAPAPALFSSAYRALLGKGFERIVSVHIAHTLSGTFNNARLAA